jgi:hypothetical protein
MHTPSLLLQYSFTSLMWQGFCDFSLNDCSLCMSQTCFYKPQLNQTLNWTHHINICFDWYSFVLAVNNEIFSTALAKIWPIKLRQVFFSQHQLLLQCFGACTEAECQHFALLQNKDRLHGEMGSDLLALRSLCAKFSGCRWSGHSEYM